MSELASESISIGPGAPRRVEGRVTVQLREHTRTSGATAAIASTDGTEKQI